MNIKKVKIWLIYFKKIFSSNKKKLNAKTQGDGWWKRI